MAQEKTPDLRPCPQDCRQCSMLQHTFCSAQISYTLSGEVERLKQDAADIRAEVVGLLAEIKAMLASAEERMSALEERVSAIEGQLTTPVEKTPAKKK